MAKKILKVISRIVGVLLLLAGIFALVIALIFCLWMFMDGYGHWKLLLPFPIILLVIYIGYRMLLLKKITYYVDKWKSYRKAREQSLYQKEQKRHEEALQVAEQMAEAKKQAIAEGTFKDPYEEKQRMLQQKASYVDTPLPNQRQEIYAHFCTDTDMLWKVLTVISALLSIATLLTIPLFIKVLPEEYILVYTCVATVIFFGSAIMAVGTGGHLKGDLNVVFVTTDQRLLYKFDLNTMFRQGTEIHMSKVSQIVANQRRINENEEIQHRIDAFLQDRATTKEVIDRTINAPKDSVSMEATLTKLNSPVMKKKLTGTYIKYWDEHKEKWEIIFLPKKTEGYEKICTLIESRNR